MHLKNLSQHYREKNHQTTIAPKHCGQDWRKKKTGAVLHIWWTNLELSIWCDASTISQNCHGIAARTNIDNSRRGTLFFFCVDISLRRCPVTFYILISLHRYGFLRIVLYCFYRVPCIRLQFDRLFFRGVITTTNYPYEYIYIYAYIATARPHSHLVCGNSYDLPPPLPLSLSSDFSLSIFFYFLYVQWLIQPAWHCHDNIVECNSTDKDKYYNGMIEWTSGCECVLWWSHISPRSA